MIEKLSEVLIMTLLEVFGVDNSSSSPAGNFRNNFLMLGEGDTFGIDGSFGAPEKKFSINFSKGNKMLLQFTL